MACHEVASCQGVIHVIHSGELLLRSFLQMFHSNTFWHTSTAWWVRSPFFQDMNLLYMLVSMSHLALMKGYKMSSIFYEHRISGTIPSDARFEVSARWPRILRPTPATIFARLIVVGPIQWDSEGEKIGKSWNFQFGLARPIRKMCCTCDVPIQNLTYVWLLEKVDASHGGDWISMPVSLAVMCSASCLLSINQ